MGTRADFYIGVGENAEWLGSVGWDGYEWDEEDHPLMFCTTEDDFRCVVEQIANERDDWTSPDMGWPWPWDDSSITDYTYYFHNGQVSCEDRSDWPDMSDKRNTAWGHRSGLLVFGG